jgi:hydrogenase-4 membrane subunit HyfE
MRRVRPNTLERRNTSRPLVNVIMILLPFVIVTLNAFVVWILVMLLHSVKKKRVMVMKVNNKAETDREDEQEKIPPLKDADDV